MFGFWRYINLCILLLLLLYQILFLPCAFLALSLQHGEVCLFVYTDDKGFLKNFIDSTQSLSPEEKGEKLENDEVNNNIYSLL